MSAKDELRDLRRDHLKLRDEFEDLLTGVETWKTYKIDSLEWTNYDEMLLRWVEHARDRNPI